MGGKKFAHFKIDYGSNKRFVSFLKKKSEVAEDTLKFISQIKGEGKDLPHFFRLDRAGENMTMRDAVKRKYPSIMFEFTARDIPQQNGKVERFIATIWSRMRAMFDVAGIKGRMREKLWAEAMDTAVIWSNLTVMLNENRRAEAKWCNNLPN